MTDTIPIKPENGKTYDGWVINENALRSPDARWRAKRGVVWLFASTQEILVAKIVLYLNAEEY